MPKTTRDNALDIHALGLKATWPRLKLLQLFQNSPQRHLSADEVHQATLADGDQIGLATIYRVLTQFEQAGLLERHHFEAGKAVFELKEGPHHDHLVCQVCGQVEEFHDAAIEHLQQEVAAQRGFKLQAHVLALYGVCANPACAARAARE